MSSHLHPHAFLIDLQSDFEKIREKSQYFGNQLGEVNARLNWITLKAAACVERIEQWMEAEVWRPGA